MIQKSLTPLLLVGLIASLILLGCAPVVVPPPATNAPATSAGDATYPQTHIDALGREVTIQSRPNRIVSLAPSITESLFAIGAGPQVVARSTFDNYPPEVEALPAIGGVSPNSISVESIVALEPDLVLTAFSSHAELVQALEDAGITAFVLEPKSFEEILDALATLGQITGNVEGAAKVIANMKARAAAVTEKIATIPPEKRVTVFYEVWHEPLMSTSNASFIGDLITMAGGINIFGDLEEEWPVVSAEQIIEADPQVILGPSQHVDQLTPEVIAGRPGWENLTAVRNGAIYIIDGDIISRPGPRAIDALETLAALLYPDLFQD